MKRSYFFIFFRAVIGALFFYSGYAKLMEPSANFVGVIIGYELVNAQTASWIAVALPWIEVVAGAFLFLGLWLRPALYALWGLNTVFFIAISSALMRGIALHDCGCFGEAAHGLPIQATLALDAVLFMVFFLMNLKKEDTAFLSLDRVLKT